MTPTPDRSPPLLVVQARMSSSRLPGKSLRSLSGTPLVAHLMQRLIAAFPNSNVVLATSQHPSDDPLARLAQERHWHCVRGDLDHVARRFVQVLDHYPADWLVRLSGDSPLLDPAIIRLLWARLQEELQAGHQPDLLTNVQVRSFPKGQSVELLRSSILRRAVEEMNNPADREHVTPWFYRNITRYNIINIVASPPLPHVQMCVDSQEDWARMESLFSQHGPEIATLPWEEIAKLLLQENPPSL